MGLNGRVGSGVARFGGEELHDRALGLQLRLALVEPMRRLFDEGARRLQPDHMGNDQLVHIALFFSQGRPGLHALACVADGPDHGGHAAAQAKGRHHESGEAEHRLAWASPLPSTPPSRFSLGTYRSSKITGEVLDDRIPNLFSCLPGTRPGVPCSTAKKWDIGRHGQHGVQLRVAAIGR